MTTAAEFHACANRHATHAFRLILAELLEDDDARDIIVDEINDCADCWRAIATRQTFAAASYMRLYLGQHKAVAQTEFQITGCIDAATTATDL